MLTSSAYTRQSPSRDCLHLLVTCAHFPGESAGYFPLPTGVEGLSLTAARINTYAGRPVRETTYHATADTTLHLFASPWSGYYFVAEYSQYRQQHKCSCGEALCEHIRQLRGIV